MRRPRTPTLQIGAQRDFIVLAPRSELTWNNYAQLRQSLCEGLVTADRRCRTGVVVDLSGATLPDTSGLWLLARTSTRAGLLGLLLRVVVPARDTGLRETLRAIGLDGLVQVYARLGDALEPPVSPVARVRATAPVRDAADVLDAIRDLRGNGAGPPLDPPPSDLRIAMATRPDDQHTQLTVRGVLDHVTLGHLGARLTSLVDRNLHHLVVRLHRELKVQVNPLPVLLGIRWRVAAQGGCLSLPLLPDRLRLTVDREGLASAFRSCQPSRGLPGAALVPSLDVSAALVDAGP
ncbi:STAS domain-containing protein [Spirillospora sp. CA-294931]|uniref:STAS domain-containing protein n=1 Tax=Spirillospora sp. CA-294931 TaxID=3240042 RepID=UPI003D9017CE